MAGKRQEPHHLNNLQKPPTLKTLNKTNNKTKSINKAKKKNLKKQNT